VALFSMTLNDKQSPPSSHGPFTSPLDRYAHLPEPTRIFLENLRKDDIQTLEGIIVSYRRAGIAGWLIKWLFVTAFTVAGSVALFSQHLATIFKFFTGG
jgi:hypothetical protein